MKRFLLFLTMGIAIASFAGVHANAAQICDSGLAFGAKRIRLITGLDPTKLSNPKHANPAPPYGNVDATPLGLLERAFCIASSNVQGALNKLDYLFVTNDAGWGSVGPVGIWSVNDKMQYIVIPSATLTNMPSSLSAEENALYNDSRVFTPPKPFSYFANNGAQTQESATLAVIAHELGHVLFAATNADGRDFDQNHGNRDPGKVPDPCFDNSFITAWNATKYKGNGKMQRRWVVFGDTNGNSLLAPPTFADLQGEINAGKADLMTTFYKNGQLVSILATVAPEEDFVETFKYYALAQATPSLDITFAGTSNVPHLVSRVKPLAGDPMGDRVSCIIKFMGNMPQPIINR